MIMAWRPQEGAQQSNRELWHNGPPRNAPQQASAGGYMPTPAKPRAPNPPPFSTWPNAGKFGFLRPSFNRHQQPSMGWMDQLMPGIRGKMGWM